MSGVHLHLILNHVPPIAIPIGLTILLVGLLRANATLVRTSLVLFVAVALVTVPVHMTGEPAEDAVEDLPGVSSAIIEEHEDAGFVGLMTALALGVASAAALPAMRRNRMLAPGFGYGILALAMVATAALTWTSALGGQIRHTEIRGDAPAVNDAGGEAGEESEDDGHDRGRGRGRGGRE